MTRARLQEASIFYERRYDCGPPRTRYELKLDDRSAHSPALDAVEPGSAVLDLGCSRACLGGVLRTRKGCRVTGVAASPPAGIDGLDEFIVRDLNNGLPPLDLGRFRYVLLLDVLAHLAAPEEFVDDQAWPASAGSEPARDPHRQGLFFSYEMYLVVEPRPSLELLLRRADAQAEARRPGAR